MATNEERELTGGCLCGRVRFVVDETPWAAGYCHCTRCQRRTGTAASPNALAVPGSFRFVEGSDAVTYFAPPDGFEKAFCSECGAHLCSRNPDDHDQVGIRYAAFDSDPGIPFTYRQFVDYAAPWEPIPDDGLERFPERRTF